MNFLVFSEVRQRVIRLPGFVEYPSIRSDNNMWRLVSALDKSHSDSICTLLNSINNQGMTWIDCLGHTYSVNGVVLPLDRLSTGERVFLLGYVAEVTGGVSLLAQGI